MRSSYDIKKEIEEITNELEEIERMTEAEATSRFNVDSKDQIIAIDNELLSYLYNELDAAADSENETYVTPAEEYFGSELAMNLFLY